MKNYASLGVPRVVWGDFSALSSGAPGRGATGSTNRLEGPGIPANHRRQDRRRYGSFSWNSAAHPIRRQKPIVCPTWAAPPIPRQVGQLIFRSARKTPDNIRSSESHLVPQMADQVTSMYAAHGDSAAPHRSIAEVPLRRVLDRQPRRWPKLERLRQLRHGSPAARF